MIVVDTSVWIDHVRKSRLDLLGIIQEGLLLHHPFVTAELALGSIPDRERFCTMLGRFPQLEPMGTEQLLDFVAEHQLHGTGIGMVDAHVLASTALVEGAVVWALDKRLASQAERLGFAYGSA